MKKIVLISCSGKKLTHSSIAKKMYISDLFKKSFQYAKTISKNESDIYILSGKYGLLSVNDVIESYDLNLKNQTKDYLITWSKKVFKQILSKNIEDELFIFICGKIYYKYLLPYIKHYELPLSKLRIGKRLSFIKNEINKKYSLL